MQKETYDRPREKLLTRGASALTLPELIQVILGSGSKGYPVARMARRVSELVLSPDLSGNNLAQQLRLIKGMGAARVLQILAVVEVSRRLRHDRKEEGYQAYRPWLESTGSIGRPLAIRYCLLDGGGAVLTQAEYIPKKSEHYVFSVRQILRKSLAQGVGSIALSLGGRDHSLELDIYELGFVRTFYEQMAVVQIPVREVLLVSAVSKRTVHYKDTA